MAKPYGEWLREQRVKSGMTQQQLADAAIMTRTHITHIEAGRRVPSEEDAKRLDRALDTGDVLTNFRPGADAYPVPDFFGAALHFEQQASIIREFAISFVPGLLQTPEYARAVIGSAYPPVSDEDRDRAVDTRIERARILKDPVEPIVWALLDEAVLRRPMGSAAVMAEQLHHIADLAERGRIRVHVIPYSAGAYPLLDSMVSLMWFEDQPPIAYVEGVLTGKVHDIGAVVEHIQGSYDLALAEALPLQESLALLRATAKDYEGDDN
ncbi:Scr1 family TA system antitoxin-like transcriptional regulator [Streptomyces sp. NPDC020412]|uniref:helix-turn-helix domain-containing protein n=1 Tax=Streptomyces sp. NPDC020412 TaxID=3365073 RepID=UPI0037A58FCD